jgi:peptidoglycan hydrolase-like protein with peptidoglycan-binding domain
MMDASAAPVVVPPDVHIHPAESGTPLAALLQDQAEMIAKRKAATAAKRAAKGAAKGAKKKLKGFLHAPAVGPPAPAQTNVAVADLQSALIKRGAKLSRDGMYGPKTAAAWKALANQKHLSPMISRVGPKIARVATNTFDVLSVPAIP